MVVVLQVNVKIPTEYISSKSQEEMFEGCGVGGQNVLGPVG